MPRCTPDPSTDVDEPCGPYRHFSAGDFNRDGHSDLYVWNRDARVLEVFAGGAAGFGDAPIYTAPVPP